MKVVFLTNYLNVHQLAFSEAMTGTKTVQYTFIATIPTPEFRLKSGYTDMNSKYGFVLRAYENGENRQKAIDLCTECDVLITGSAPEEYLRERMRQKKLTFRYSERIYKKRSQLFQLPLRALKYRCRDRGNPNVYLLCASAYAAGDYAKTGIYKGKAYKWGYFPEVKRYDDPDGLIAAKRSASILWVARLIGLKHPDASILVAKRLKQEGYSFTLNLIGSGGLEGELREMIRANGLEDRVYMRGVMPPEKVREYMEQSEIFLFTSDRNEGWGAVLNESMNSACAVVASGAIGSVPFLIEDGKNGLVYEDGNVDDLTKKVRFLLDHPDRRVEYGRQAYKTMAGQWNAENAAERFVKLASAISKGEDCPFDSGVCSRAK